MEITNSERALSMMVCFMFLLEKAAGPSAGLYHQIAFGLLAVAAFVILTLIAISHFWTER
jgi:hypothetical protein